MRAVQHLCGLVLVSVLMTAGNASAQQRTSREDPVPMGEAAQINDYEVSLATSIRMRLNSSKMLPKSLQPTAMYS